MTASLHNFADYRPAPLLLSPGECARLEVMSAARAILHSRHRHSDHTLTWACRAIDECADRTDPDELCDLLTAEIKMDSIGRRRRATVAPRRGKIRLALLDAVGLAVFAVAVGAVFLVGAPT